MTASDPNKKIAPTSIGIIMDGNRRWAKEQGLPKVEGHHRGYNKIHEFLSWAREAGIQEVVLYAFSTENWNRAPEEVSYLMDIITTMFAKELQQFITDGIRIRFIGQLERAPEKVQKVLTEAEEQTASGTKGALAVAFSYGGRTEIVAAVNKLIGSGARSVTEEEFSDALSTSGLHDPDLIIRTGGEKRLSNFLPWQSVYSELFFTDTKWPAFSKEEFDSILAEFATRERRHGK